MSTYHTATEPTSCAICHGVILTGDTFVIDGETGKPVGYECGCGDPANADGDYRDA